MNLINRESVIRAIAKCAVFTHGIGFCVSLLLLVTSVSTFEVNAQSQIQGPRDNPQVYSGVVYGPIDQNDTLWRIASRYKQEAQFTVYQTMMAIYELNQQAFENGNFNTMVNGATLQLPSDRYIARVDPQQARAKADSDEKALGRESKPADATGQKNTEAEPQASTLNLKPEVPLVNQDDLSNTSKQFQAQLNGLRQQQQLQFQQLKNQVATSITSVEILLQENKNLNDQLLKIDEKNRSLTQKVETELQIQIDEQVEQLSQLIALVKDAEQRRIDEESRSIMQILSTPMALIIMMSSVTILLITGLAFFFLRKPAAPIPESQGDTETTDIVDDELIIGEVDDALDQDSADLMAALSEENDLEEDDILSDALEDDDSISMLSDDDLEAELDGLDDMLVPDSPSDFTDLDISDDSFGEDLDLEDEATSVEAENGISLDDEQVESVVPIEEISEPKAKLIPSPLTKNLDLDEDENDGVPSGIELDVNGDIDENTIEQIGNQIEEKDQAITKLTDELLDELDNATSDTGNIEESESDDELTSASNGGLLDLDNEEPDDKISNTELDALLDSIDDDPVNIDSDDDFDNLLGVGDDVESDLPVDDLGNDQVSALADELLQELESEESQADELEKLLEGIDNNESDEVQTGDAFDTAVADESSNEIKRSADLPDADDLLDDIPSFTSDLPDEVTEDLVENKAEGATFEEAIVEDNLTSTANELENDATGLDDREDESDEDMLSGLPGLDNWLDEDDEVQLKELSESAQDDELDLSALELDIDELSNAKSEEDDLIKGLDEADFDDMLNDLADNNADNPSVDIDANTSGSNSDGNNGQPANKDPLGTAGLDLDALMTPDDSVVDKNDSLSSQSDEFVDVDDLLKESDAMAKPNDEDMELDLDSSLDKLMPNSKAENEFPNDNSDAESNQSSNLDLAQVYIDMEDFVAAKELLEEVTRLGNQDQQEEANVLLGQIKS